MVTARLASASIYEMSRAFSYAWSVAAGLPVCTITVPLAL